MFFLNREEQIHFRILIAIVIICGIFYLISEPTTLSLKDLAVQGENQLAIHITSDNEIEIKNPSRTGKTKPNCVIINSSSFEELLVCPGIGEKKAKQIIKEREISPFVDWRDLQDRIKGISPNQIDILKESGIRINASDSNYDK